jgi:hypothetical protein
MKKLALLYSIIFCCSVAFAQFKVKFVVNEQVPAHEPVYIVGSFNNWDPGEKNHQLSGKDGKFQIDVRMAQGHHEYKFTRGSWATVETTEAGLDINNRVVNIYKDTTIKIVIEGWMDNSEIFLNSQIPPNGKWLITEVSFIWKRTLIVATNMPSKQIFGLKNLTIQSMKQPWPAFSVG